MGERVGSSTSSKVFFVEVWGDYRYNCGVLRVAGVSGRHQRMHRENKSGVGAGEDTEEAFQGALSPGWDPNFSHPPDLHRDHPRPQVHRPLHSDP